MRDPTFVWILASSLAISISHAQTPPELQRIEDQRVSAIAKIEKTYIEELQKQRASYAKSGNQSAVALIDEKLKSAGLETPAPPIDSIVGEWHYSKSGIGHQSFVLYENSTAQHATGVRGTWHVGRSKLFIKWDNGRKVSFDLPPVDNTLKGEDVDGAVIATKGAKPSGTTSPPSGAFGKP